MFDLVAWDSPLALVGEIALSVVFIAVILLVVRLVNARSSPPAHDGGDAARQPLDKDE